MLILHVCHLNQGMLQDEKSQLGCESLCSNLSNKGIWLSHFWVVFLAKWVDNFWVAPSFYVDIWWNIDFRQIYNEKGVKNTQNLLNLKIGAILRWQVGEIL